MVISPNRGVLQHPGASILTPVDCLHRDILYWCPVSPMHPVKQLDIRNIVHCALESVREIP